MLSVDLESRKAVERLEAAAERADVTKSELARLAVAAMCDYIERGGSLKGAELIQESKAAQINRLSEIARTTNESPTRILRELVDAIEPMAETGAIPRPIKLRAGPVDARSERIAGMLAVLRRNIQDLELLLE
jgi:predicted transcriptional regulator